MHKDDNSNRDSQIKFPEAFDMRLVLAFDDLVLAEDDALEVRHVIAVGNQVLQTVVSEHVLGEVQGNHTPHGPDYLGNHFISQLVPDQLHRTHLGPTQELAYLHDGVVPQLGIGQVQDIQPVVVQAIKHFLVLFRHLNHLQLLLGRSFCLLDEHCLDWGGGILSFPIVGLSDSGGRRGLVVVHGVVMSWFAFLLVDCRQLFKWLHERLSRHRITNLRFSLASIVLQQTLLIVDR